MKQKFWIKPTTTKIVTDNFLLAQFSELSSDKLNKIYYRWITGHELNMK